MRIAILLQDFSGGGVERNMLNLTRGFLDRGHMVDLLLARPVGPLATQCPEKARVIPLQAHGSLGTRLAVARADPWGAAALAAPLLLRRHKRQGQMVPRLLSLAAHLRREPPDVLMTAKFWPNLCGAWAKRLAGDRVPLVLTERQSPTEHFGPKRGGGRHRSAPMMMRRYYPWADRLVCVSSDLADDLARFAKLRRERIDVIYNPVVDDQILTAAREDPDHPWLSPGEPPVVLGVGRLEARKGFTTLVRAFAAVRRVTRARLIILGEGKTAEATAAQSRHLLGLCRVLGIENDVDLPGFKANPFAFMARAGVYVLSSEYEGLPGTLIQAMATGCPVVSTDCPTGPREILEGGRLGPLVPVGDHEAMAQAIVAALRTGPSPALVTRARDFSADTAVEAYLALFRGLLRPTLPLMDQQRPA